MVETIISSYQGIQVVNPEIGRVYGAMLSAGYHGCKPKLLDPAEMVKLKFVDDVVRTAGLTALGEAWHQFSPEGVTGLVVLAESHITFHSWPEAENRYAALDYFCCASRADGMSEVERFKASADKAIKAHRRAIRLLQPDDYTAYLMIR